MTKLTAPSFGAQLVNPNVLRVSVHCAAILVMMMAVSLDIKFTIVSVQMVTS